MSIAISWFDPLVPVTGFKIYRSESPIKLTALPAPLATVGPEIREYVDTTCPRNKVLYYRVSALSGEEEAVGQEMVTGYFPYTGPGPQTLLRGDTREGYFGTLPIEEIITPSDFKAWSGMAGAVFTTPPTKWGKFIRNGKILFFPVDGGFINESILASAYLAGCFYGGTPESLWGPNLISTYGVIPQTKTLTKNGHEFYVRVPRVHKEPWDSGGNYLEDPWQGEIRLFMSIYHNSVSDSDPRIKRLDDYAYPSINTIVMEIAGNNGYVLPPTPSFEAPSTRAFSNTASSYLRSNVFRPVLELIL